jgi:hypothetical protein
MTMNGKILNLSDDELDAVTGCRKLGCPINVVPSAADQALLGVVRQMNADTVAVLKDAGIKT